jgi:hypothetical protein
MHENIRPPAIGHDKTISAIFEAWSIITLLFAAAILATIPISPQVTPRGVELRVDEAGAVTYGRYRRVHRRVAWVRALEIRDLLGRWRREWDSNPRWTCAHASFQDWCLKPLGHLSELACALAVPSRRYRCA